MPEVTTCLSLRSGNSRTGFYRRNAGVSLAALHMLRSWEDAQGLLSDS